METPRRVLEIMSQLFSGFQLRRLYRAGRGVTPTQPIHFTEGEDESLPPAGCDSIVKVFKLPKSVRGAGGGGDESTDELWEDLTEEHTQRSLQNSPQRLPLQTGL